jgi:hypothetical protein
LRVIDLRLDLADGAVGSVIMAGNAAKSDLIDRVTNDDPELFMPPPAAKKPRLTAGEVELLKKWIDAGAKYDAHWSYVPPVRHEPPVITEEKWKAWPQGTIDAFVLAGQLEHGLTPAPPADKRTLVRRLSLDLTGLPPTPAEVAAFENDASPEAYEKRADGGDVARRGEVRRHGRLPQRQPSRLVVVPRLGHRGV